jgi:hypothetical protein
LKGKWSIRQRHRFHSTSSVLSFLAGIPPTLQFDIIFTPTLFTKGGESLQKGLYFTHKYPFLAIHAKGGESISTKQKDRTTNQFQFKNVPFQFVLKKFFKRISNWYLIFDIISNWYNLFKINI